MYNVYLQEFLALELFEGKIYLSFNLGASTSHIKATKVTSIADGKWHKVTRLKVQSCETLPKYVIFR